jgi:chromosome partitioning protein
LKTISILSQKGGAGKTTVAVHLATAAAAQGVRTALVDLDPQANARKWGDKRDTNEPDVVGDHASRLPQLAELARANGANLLVIDTAPNADQASLIAARAADFILMPCRPAAFDLEAIEATIDLARLAKKPFAIVLNAAPHQGGGLVTEARKGLEELWGASVCPITLHARVAYSHSVIDGRTAIEFEPDGKAADEIKKLFAWTCGQVGMEPRGRVLVAA